MMDFKRYMALSKQKDWAAVHALLDDVRENAATPGEIASEIYFRVSTLEDQGLLSEALDLLQEKRHLYKSEAYATHVMARLLIRLGREQDASDIMSGSPYEAEMALHPMWAMDAKFFHIVMLAKAGDPSVRDRLNEIPDGYIQITIDRDHLITKEDLIASLRE